MTQPTLDSRNADASRGAARRNCLFEVSGWRCRPTIVTDGRLLKMLGAVDVQTVNVEAGSHGAPLSASTFARSTAGETPIRAAHVMELRAAVVALE